MGLGEHSGYASESPQSPRPERPGIDAGAPGLLTVPIASRRRCAHAYKYTRRGPCLLTISAPNSFSLTLPPPTSPPLLSLYSRISDRNHPTPAISTLIFSSTDICRQLVSKFSVRRRRAAAPTEEQPPRRQRRPWRFVKGIFMHMDDGDIDRRAPSSWSRGSSSSSICEADRAPRVGRTL